MGARERERAGEENHRLLSHAVMRIKGRAWTAAASKALEKESELSLIHI